ncbi:MAG: carbon-nitrogen family hydrolase [Oscillospiraceae bacterium]|nr:carbon-nitrogen family hydrolase [Oscillospiraceae bacterium]
MKISCVQMDMLLGDPVYNFSHAEELVREAAERDAPDVVVLPETWNTGYFPKPLSGYDRDGVQTKRVFSALAKELNVNIVCGSVVTQRNGRFYNTAYVFDRNGVAVAGYDKIHLFTHAGEHDYFCAGDHLCRFRMENADCGLIICYDLRFPELIRTLAVQGIDVLFVVAQWPEQRLSHLTTLAKARAIENQMFLALCNSVGEAGETRCGGGSAVIDPWGEYIARAWDGEEIISGEADLSVLQGIRDSINVFRDRRPELYSVS